MTPPPEPTGEIRPFAAILQDLGRGAVAAELAGRLHDLVSAVAEHEKTGSLTLKISVKPMGEGSVAVTAEVTDKTPVGTLPTSLFFITGDGNLSRDNPAQPSLPLREVPRRDDTVHDIPEREVR